ncbi:MAG: IreB family regulatory phosphoprotein [Clostridia bacterium]|nr:IreB family regulatory phosphoprotein [Clostridia bacterium]MBQ7048811.1 IreB family regulatory phosphoprotein [Clostridia bacterium]
MSAQNGQKTQQFNISNDKNAELRKQLTQVYDALKEKGYNPINQIVGYIMSEDPTYITSYNNARSIISKMDRYELMHVLVQDFLRV